MSLTRTLLTLSLWPVFQIFFLTFCFYAPWFTTLLMTDRVSCIQHSNTTSSTRVFISLYHILCFRNTWTFFPPSQIREVKMYIKTFFSKVDIFSLYMKFTIYLIYLLVDKYCFVKFFSLYPTDIWKSWSQICSLAWQSLFWHE